MLLFRFAENPNYYDGYNDKMKNSSDPNFHVRSVTRNFQSADFGLRSQDMTSPAKVLMVQNKSCKSTVANATFLEIP